MTHFRLRDDANLLGHCVYDQVNPYVQSTSNHRVSYPNLSVAYASVAGRTISRSSTTGLLRDPLWHSGAHIHSIEVFQRELTEEAACIATGLQHCLLAASCV